MKIFTGRTIVNTLKHRLHGYFLTETYGKNYCKYTQTSTTRVFFARHLFSHQQDDELMTTKLLIMLVTNKINLA